MKKKFIKLITSIILLVLILLACDKGVEEKINKKEEEKGINLMAYRATDDLGRKLPYYGDENLGETNPKKQVGIFYFVWHGARQVPGPHDVSKIIGKDPNAASSNEKWLAAGGGAAGTNHWWGEPLFGYFRNNDKWVMEKDVQMLTDAGVDFVVFDYSNGNSYTDSVLVFLEILNRYYKQGFNVPKISFVTKAESVRHMREIYKDIYESHPEYEHLWYMMNGKPMIIGNNKATGIEDLESFFTVKYAQWPREEYHDDGFPWVDFSIPQRLYGQEKGPTIMSVSVAQHSGTIAFSSSAFYGDKTNKSRSFHDGILEEAEDAYLHGYNFAWQFEYAISASPDIIFVTGWNEWIATRQASGSWKYLDGSPNNDPIILVDCADIENSRDIQPMRGGYGDNYYMQLIDYIRKFKGISLVNSKNDLKEKAYGTINFNGTFDDWEEIGISYYDYTEDINHRNARGYGREVYVNESGRNDIYKTKVAVDDKYIYFYVECVDNLTFSNDKQWMNLFIKTGNNDKNWYGYDYLVKRNGLEGDAMILEKSLGDWNWEQVSKIKFQIEGKRMQIGILLSDLALKSGQEIDLEFKWADNYQEPEDGKLDFFTFYLDGDAAPYGRLNFVFKF